jgi:hypothetical protein
MSVCDLSITRDKIVVLVGMSSNRFRCSDTLVMPSLNNLRNIPGSKPGNGPLCLLVHEVR